MERFEGRNEQTLSQSTRKLTAGARNVEARAKRALNFLVINNICHSGYFESEAALFAAEADWPKHQK